MVSARYTTSRYYFSQDHLGSTTAIFNQDGAFMGRYSYSPYGENRINTNNTVTNDNAIRYIGGYLDTDAGLYRLGARHYDPAIGRFTQVDPSGQEANAYAYASCNPINQKDPSGLLSGACARALVGVLLDVLGIVVGLYLLVGGLPTIVASITGAIKFALNVAKLVYHVGKAIEEC